MRILDLTAIYPNPAVDFEGRSVAALDRALARSGARVTTLVLKPWMPLALARRIPRYRHLAVPSTRVGATDEGNPRVVFCRYPRVPRLPEAWRFAANARLLARHALRRARRLGPFDVVHVQGFPTAPPALQLAEALGLPLAVTYRDDPGHHHPDRLHPLERRVLERAAAWFVISPMVEHALRPLLAAAGAGEPPVIVTPNGLDLAEIETRLAETPGAEIAGPDGGRIVGVGNLYRWKGFHEALEALARLPPTHAWHYTIVGDGPYRAELEQLAIERGIAGRVTFTGRLSHGESLARIRAADIFLLPSWREAFGNVFTEAAACGVAAIGCLENGPETIIDHGETGLLVPPSDAQSLADAIARLLANPAATRRMGETARRRVGRFTWASTASLVLDTLARIVRGAEAEA